MGEGSGLLQRDVAQGRGTKDEELGHAEALGFGGAPVAEASFECLLGWGQGRWLLLLDGPRWFNDGWFRGETGGMRGFLGFSFGALRLLRVRSE